MMWNLAIGSDHRGYRLKQVLQNFTELSGARLTWTDVGCAREERCDYPPYAFAVADLVRQGKVDAGIVLCGTGGGMAIAANRLTGVRCVVAWSAETAQRAREEDCANILALPADYLDEEAAVKCIEAWLTASCKPGRYENRWRLIDTVARDQER